VRASALFLSRRAEGDWVLVLGLTSAAAKSNFDSSAQEATMERLLSLSRSFAAARASRYQRARVRDLEGEWLDFRLSPDE
jgi:hypothetical protein